MDFAKYIVKARPGILGGRFEEKRPLRERIVGGSGHFFNFVPQNHDNDGLR